MCEAQCLFGGSLSRPPSAVLVGYHIITPCHESQKRKPHIKIQYFLFIVCVVPLTTQTVIMTATAMKMMETSLLPTSRLPGELGVELGVAVWATAVPDVCWPLRPEPEAEACGRGVIMVAGGGRDGDPAVGAEPGLAVTELGRGALLAKPERGSISTMSTNRGRTQKTHRSGFGPRQRLRRRS